MKLPSRILAVVAIAAVAATAFVVLPLTADAASAKTVAAKDYPQNLLMSDSVMYYTGTMTAAKIQAFLNTQGKDCTSKGSVICLKDYKVTTPSIAQGTLCAATTGKANETAASIIYKWAKACGVNPQVILTTMQKEQSLLTAVKATANVYKYAMGYYCIDGQSCDQPEYIGFNSQVRYGAAHFARESTDVFPVGQTSSIDFNTQARPECGSTTVTPLNNATSREYVYTPYMPNPQLLAGKPNSCSVAGNLNFWQIFNKWFGPSVLATGSQAFVKQAYVDLVGRAATSTDVYTKALAATTSHSRASSVATPLLVSATHRAALITADYENILGQTATAANIASFQKRLSAKTIKQDDLDATFYASSTFYSKYAGSTPSGYVTALFSRILNETPTASQQTLWQRKITSLGRVGTAVSLLHTATSSSVRASQVYETYLPSVSPTSAELSSLASSITSKGYTAAVATFLAGSAYGAKAISTYGTIY